MSETALQIGTETVSMYSIKHLHTGLWLTIHEDGGIRLDSPEPVYLGTFYDEPDADTEAFAYAFLVWLRENVSTNYVINGRFIDIAKADLDYAIVCRFSGQRPVHIEMPQTSR